MRSLLGRVILVVGLYTHTYIHIIKYIIAIIILNKWLSVRLIKNKKNRSFYFTFTYSFFDALFSFCRSKYLTYIIFLCCKVQLALKQQGFELCRSIYMQFFFNSKYYITTWSVVGWVLRCGTINTEEPQIWRAHYKLYLDFQLHESLAP